MYLLICKHRKKQMKIWEPTSMCYRGNPNYHSYIAHYSQERTSKVELFALNRRAWNTAQPQFQIITRTDPNVITLTAVSTEGLL